MAKACVGFRFGVLVVGGQVRVGGGREGRCGAYRQALEEAAVQEDGEEEGQEAVNQVVGRRRAVWLLLLLGEEEGAQLICWECL